MTELQIIHEVVLCHVAGCEETATGWWNASSNMASSIPSRFVAVCDKHNPLKRKRGERNHADDQELADMGFSS
jgi:hypothetical protein